MKTHYPRQFETDLAQRLHEEPRFIQTILGPRQVGKTSGVVHVLESQFNASEYAYFSSEDDVFDPEWFLAQVQKAHEQKKKIIAFDEIQKVDRWSELVKLAWDKQKRQKRRMHWLLLGSSSLNLSQGLSESLAGRFEILPAPHWSFAESKNGSGLSLDDYIQHGGYPASYALVKDPKRFRRYMLESIFETVVSRDILHYASVKKPALFRQTFILANQYPAQEISFNKLLGQLQEAGNVDQIKHYLDLFEQGFLLRLIFKYSASPRSRLSSPKIIPSAPVFSSLFLRRQLSAEEKGRVFESIVGQRLCEKFDAVHYWRDGQNEIDYIVESGGALFAVEVKSKRRKIPGFGAFKAKYKRAVFCTIDFENYLEFEMDPELFLNTYAI